MSTGDYIALVGLAFTVAGMIAGGFFVYGKDQNRISHLEKSFEKIERKLEQISMVIAPMFVLDSADAQKTSELMKQKMKGIHPQGNPITRQELDRFLVYNEMVGKKEVFTSQQFADYLNIANKIKSDIPAPKEKTEFEKLVDASLKIIGAAVIGAIAGSAIEALLVPEPARKSTAKKSSKKNTAKKKSLRVR